MEAKGLGGVQGELGQRELRWRTTLRIVRKAGNAARLPPLKNEWLAGRWRGQERRGFVRKKY